MSDIIKELLEARALLLGSPTLNTGVFPTVAAFSTYLKGLRPKGRIAAVFGSFGWGSKATQTLREDLAAGGMEVLEELQVKFVPLGEKLDTCEALGRRMAQRIRGS